MDSNPSQNLKVEEAPSSTPQGRLDRLLEREPRCLLATTALCFLVLLLGFAIGFGLVRSGWLPVKQGVGRQFHADLETRLTMNWRDRFVAIAKPNFTCLLVFLVGIVTFGFEATVHLGFLGVATGVAVGRLTADHIPFGDVAALLLPHAFPELLGLCLAGSLGFRAGLMFLRYVRGGELIRKREPQRMAIVAGAACGLLAVAAVVESVVTPAMAALRGVGQFLH